jgi:type II secretory pathway component GspD/PulD (secretin)
MDDLFSDESSLIRTAVLNVDDFNVLLSALKQRDGISIVSNPKIVVANGKAAVIHIGETERPFVSTVTPGQQGIAPLVTFNPGEPVDFGVKLTVTPTVNNGSNITVQIEPELTRFVRDAVAPNGQTYPIVSTKKIETVFSLENGKTVAIGGLTETEDRSVTTKVPLLGDLPVLGKYLFSHEHMETSQKETIIFVTVGLARPHQIARETGLPENTELTSRRMLDDQLRREQHQLDMLRAGIAAESELSRIQAESAADWKAFGESVAPEDPREAYPSDALAPVPTLP